MRRRVFWRIFQICFVLLVFQSGRLFYGWDEGEEGSTLQQWLLWGGLSGLCLVLAGLSAFLWWRRRVPRGAQIVSYGALKAHCERRDEQTASEPLFFGGVEGYSPEAATSHFFLAGGTGSGKTLNLSMLMGSVLPPIWQSNEKNNDRRAVIFDVKQDMVSTLLALGAPPSALTLFNPFDNRCTAWDMAGDIDAPDTALQLATILIPSEKGESNRYFPDAARDLLCGVIQVFIARGARWQLADLILAMRTPDRLRAVLSATARGRDLIALHLEAATASLNVLSTARTRLAPFEVVGALWQRAIAEGRTLSLRAFLEAPGILILGNHQSALAPIQALNRVIFQRLTELMLDQPESSTRRSWFILDEARKLGKLDGLDDLMTNGRSKGACVVLGFQDIAGMREIYGAHVAEELLGMCGSVGILKISGATTPQWASSILGEREEAIRTRGATMGENGRWSENEGESWGIRPLLLPSQFRALPRPKKGEPIYGYFRSAFLSHAAFQDKVYRAEIAPAEIARRLKMPTPEQRKRNFLPWLERDAKELREWEAADYRRLEIKVPLSISSSENIRETREAFRYP